MRADTIDGLDLRAPRRIVSGIADEVPDLLNPTFDVNRLRDQHSTKLQLPLSLHAATSTVKANRGSLRSVAQAATELRLLVQPAADLKQQLARDFKRL